MIKKCFKCNVTLESSISSDEDQELDEPTLNSIAFISHGNYGSTIFDPMDGSYLEIYVCDQCLVNFKNKVYHITRNPPIEQEPSIQTLSDYLDS